MPATPEQLTVIRLQIADTETNPAKQLLTDDQLNALFDANHSGVYLTAAAALEAIAVSEVLVSKKIRTQDLSTDGPAVAESLMKLAARCRAKAAEAGEGPTTVVFELLQAPTFGRRPELTEPEVWGL